MLKKLQKIAFFVLYPFIVVPFLTIATAMLTVFISIFNGPNKCDIDPGLKMCDKSFTIPLNILNIIIILLHIIIGLVPILAINSKINKYTRKQKLISSVVLSFYYLAVVLFIISYL